MRLASALGLCLLPLTGACTQFPALDRATDPAVFQAPYPKLLPFEQLQPASTQPVPADPAAQLAAQAAALRKRADALIAQP